MAKLLDLANVNVVANVIVVAIVNVSVIVLSSVLANVLVNVNVASVIANVLVNVNVVVNVIDSEIVSAILNENGVSDGESVEAILIYVIGVIVWANRSEIASADALNVCGANVNVSVNVSVNVNSDWKTQPGKAHASTISHSS